MKKIAIFTSGTGECASRLVSMFNEGDRIRVELVVTDRGDTRLVEQMIQKGVNAMFLPRELWRINPGNILSLLDDNQIDLIALDELDGFLPEEVAERYSGRTVTLTSPEQASHEVVAALEHREEKTVDEDWAETLKVKFDPEQVAQTPPPIPGVSPAASNTQQQAVYQQPQQGYQQPHQQGFQQPQWQQSYQQPYQQQPYQQQRPQYGYAQQNQEPMPSTYLIWSILCTIFCCFIPGIVAIVFSSQVTSKYFSGDIEGAKKASRNAEVWIIVSFVLGILTATLYLPIMLLSN